VQGDLNVVEITPTGTTFYRLAKYTRVQFKRRAAVVRVPGALQRDLIQHFVSH
jgi:hypothetical protein